METLLLAVNMCEEGKPEVGVVSGVPRLPGRWDRWRWSSSCSGPAPGARTGPGPGARARRQGQGQGRGQGPGPGPGPGARSRARGQGPWTKHTVIYHTKFTKYTYFIIFLLKQAVTVN